MHSAPSLAPVQDPAKLSPVPVRRGLWRSSSLKLLFVALFLFLTGGPAVIAQYEDANPGVYWRLERARQQQLRRQKVRKTIIQRPTRLIRRARPRRGYTRAVPAVKPPAAAIAIPSGTPPANSVPQQAGAPPANAAFPPAAVPPAATPPAGSPPTVTAGAPSADQNKPALPKADQPPAAQAPVMSIAVIGDNLASQLARGLEQAYEQTPQVEILRLSKDNSGLVRKDYYDWLEETKKLLAGDKKIDVAVMMIGSNDRQAMQVEGASHAARSPEWQKVYAARIEALAAQFKQKNIPLLWIGMPVMRIERLSADMVAFNQMYRDIVQKNGGIFIDVWEPFLDDRNRFTLYGPDVNGEIVKLRVNDGVHFTKAGARKLAHFAEIDIKRIIDKRRAPATGAAIANVAPQTPGSAVPGAAAKATKATPDISAALPAPAEPPRIVIPVKPIVGPVVELTALPVAPNGELAVRTAIRPAASQSAQAAVQAMRAGKIPEVQRGRADDFSWPRP